jgi:hypothetical protein
MYLFCEGGMLASLQAFPQMFVSANLSALAKYHVSAQDDRTMKRAYYQASATEFIATPTNEILGKLTHAHTFDLDQRQRDAWIHQIEGLRPILAAHTTAFIFIEFIIPRMGKRVDAILLLNGVVMAIEYKVGAGHYNQGDTDQALDYALDLKNFHEGSHHLPIVPILVATPSATKKGPLRGLFFCQIPVLQIRQSMYCLHTGRHQRSDLPQTG